MKKYLFAVFAVLLAVTLLACEQRTYEIALVTDVGTIDDKSFNQGAWEGVERYAEEHGISYRYYQPDDKTTDDYVDAIELAVRRGAEIVVTPGFLFENAIWVVQDEYPDVKFILLDGSPHNVIDWVTFDTLDGTAPDFTISDNVLSVNYAEEQSGFLAGYAAVMEGYTELGFMGGMAVPAVVRFGYGYAQGANEAAVELGLADNAISMNYHYLGTFLEDPAYQTRAAAWYQGGIEVIFAAAGGAGNSVMKAAEQHDSDAYVIGVDVDQKDESPNTIITSALKELGNSVYDSIASIYDGTFEGGQALMFDATNDGIGLPHDFTMFNTFNQTMYDAIYAELVAGNITILSDNEDEAAIDAATPKVNIDWID